MAVDTRKRTAQRMEKLRKDARADPRLARATACLIRAQTNPNPLTRIGDLTKALTYVVQVHKALKPADQILMKCEDVVELVCDLAGKAWRAPKPQSTDVHTQPAASATNAANSLGLELDGDQGHNVSGRGTRRSARTAGPSPYNKANRPERHKKKDESVDAIAALFANVSLDDIKEDATADAVRAAGVDMDDLCSVLQRLGLEPAPEPVPRVATVDLPEVSAPSPLATAPAEPVFTAEAFFAEAPPWETLYVEPVAPRAPTLADFADFDGLYIPAPPEEVSSLFAPVGDASTALPPVPSLGTVQLPAVELSSMAESAPQPDVALLAAELTSQEPSFLRSHARGPTRLFRPAAPYRKADRPAFKQQKRAGFKTRAEPVDADVDMGTATPLDFSLPSIEEITRVGEYTFVEKATHWLVGAELGFMAGISSSLGIEVGDATPLQLQLREPAAKMGRASRRVRCAA